LLRIEEFKGIRKVFKDLTTIYIMNEQQFTPKELSKLFGVTTQTLQEWEKEGKIRATRTQGGHRRYIHSVPIVPSPSGVSKKCYIYARVSSAKQKPDLQRQVDVLQEAYPTFEVIKDVGSGINFRRRGLITLLDQVLGGNVSHVVVAHRDRLTRFGFDMFKFLFDRFGVSFEVMSDDDIKEPATELAKDLLSVITVLTARYYGSRSYKVLSKNKVLPEQGANRPSKSVHRGVKVLLQQGRKHPERKRRQGTSEQGSFTTLGDEERQGPTPR
jgi:excisionase family DNA binding protein